MAKKAKSGASGAAGTKLPRKLTAQKVIDFFADLGLDPDHPLCDNKKQIEDKINAQRQRRLKDKARPDPAVSAKAEEWFRIVTEIRKDLGAVIDLVYEDYKTRAQTSVEGLAAGQKVTQTFVDSLAQQAVNSCKASDRLAGKFAKRFCKEANIEVGKLARRPGQIEHFTATPGQGHIALSWKLPRSNCDKVEICRAEDPGRGSPKYGAPVYGAKGSSYRDDGVTTGKKYIYQARVVFQGEKADPITSRATCLSDVLGPQAGVKEGKVHLSWKLPAPDVSVIVFRRVGKGSPTIRRGPRGPLPNAQHTTQVHRTGAAHWEDADVKEGSEYHYLLVADFGQGLYTDGVEVQCTLEKPPPAPRSLTAVYKPGTGKEAVQLQWVQAASAKAVRYAIVRRPGETPPADVKDGKLVETTSQLGHLDETVTAGKRYTYAVFSRVGNLYSKSGTASKPVDVLPEVGNLQPSTGDGTVELHWDQPDNVERVEVRYSLQPVTKPGDGQPATLLGRGHARAANLTNGRLYHFRVWCVYRPDRVTDIRTRGVTTTARPVRLPDPVTDFKVAQHSGEVVCTWTPPAHGTVVVRRSARPPSWSAGQRIGQKEVSRFGEPVTAQPDRAGDLSPDLSKPHYSVFTVAGDHAVAGGSGVCAVVRDVSDLTVAQTTTGAVLTWSWPAQCRSVVIARREGGWPAGPTDRHAHRVTCTHADYENAGHRYADRIALQPCRLYYVVYAQAAGVGGVRGRFFAQGTSTGCRARLDWKQWVRLSYELLPPGQSGGKKDVLQLTCELENPDPNFSGLVLTANADHPPLAPDDGIALCTWQPPTPEPGKPVQPGTYQAEVPLAPIERKRWKWFYCKAFVCDPAERASTLVIHPNTCVLVSADGEAKQPEVGRRDKKGKEGYDDKPPWTAICTTCFKEFPIHQMLFSSYEGEEPVRAKYSPLELTFGRARKSLKLKVPSGDHGQLLTRKWCPDKHELSQTAGLQKSLIIGLIGARYSGKTTYVAALIERLKSQVGQDMEAGLLGVTDETNNRYDKELHRPLFMDHIELPRTVGSPAPLLYELQINGRLWNETRHRSTNLALYDTAGENLNQAATARQMVQYVGVASGIMFLVDPLQIPGVRQLLPGHLPLPPQDATATPDAIITNVMSLLQRGRVVTHGGQLSIPIAVVLTKCDVLRDHGLIEPNRLWCQDERHIRGFDTRKHNDMSGMMGEYIRRWAPAVDSTVGQWFPRHSYFGVSATGCAPVGSKYKFVSPFRVQDPLLWLLAEVGVIPTL